MIQDANLKNSQKPLIDRNRLNLHNSRILTLQLIISDILDEADHPNKMNREIYPDHSPYTDHSDWHSDKYMDRSS